MAMYRKAVPLLCVFSLLLLASLCQASSVTRTFSKTSAIPGENITVNLAVSITAAQDTYYAIDETYPSGWTVMSTTGDTNQSGHVKWAIISGAVNTTQTYLIKAPAGSGTYTFSGTYMFNTTYPSEIAISGQNQVTVAANGDVDKSGCVDILDMSAIALDFGKTSGFTNPNSDVNKNGVVDIFDLVAVGRDFGSGC